MRRKTNNRKLRIPMTLKVIKNGRTIFSVTKYKKSQIFLAIEAIPFTESAITALLSVSYGKNIGKNVSEHRSEESLKKALNAYTEKPMIDFILQN